MSLQKITEEEMDAVSIARLSARPNETHGVENGMSAAGLQAAFDAFGRLNAEKYNALIDAMADGTMAASMMTAGESVAERIAACGAGHYVKPDDGIPASDLAAEVRNGIVSRDAGGLFIAY